jgi:regulator of protease activity HflC (stomatin/prohibitin superfamily)
MPFGLCIIHTSQVGIRETFGKFTQTVNPGLNFYIPFVQKIVPISTRLRQDTFNFEVKTKDNVFARLDIAVQYKVTYDNAYKAYYSLEDPVPQIDAYIENVVRSRAPQMELDELFESQDDICKSVSEILSDKMTSYGYSIENTLVTGIEPDSEVKQSMNLINANRRLKLAAREEADAHYIKEVRKAEADSERKRLQGEGISKQRLAILKGYEEGVDNMANKLGLSPKEIVDFVMKTQHLDTLESIGRSNNTKTLFLNHDPHGFRNDLISSKEVEE